MTTDTKELIELAARAYGFENPQCVELSGVLLGVSLGDEVFKRTGKTFWNPAIDDGDALRLAVTLRIDILQKYEGAVLASNHRYGARELYNADPYAATRHAIVRAAAEIQRRKEI